MNLYTRSVFQQYYVRMQELVKFRVWTPMYFISISTQTQNIKLCNVGKYNQSKDEKADKQH